MASVKRRSDRRSGWRARYRDEDGREHSKTFARKVDAQRWIDEVTTSIVTGTYVHPNAGRVTVKAYAEQWRAAQVHRPSSAAHVETMLRRHVYPTLGHKQLAAVRPSDIQALVAGLPLAPSTVGVVHGILASIFKAAVRDRCVAASPCDGTRLPKVQPRRIDPLTLEVVQVLIDALPEHLRALCMLAAGSGMRQGECLGLTVDRLDFLRRTVRVDRQLIAVPGHELHLAPPKTPASHREVPLPQVVVDALAQHLAAFPVSASAEFAEGLVFTTVTSRPWRRSALAAAWRAAGKRAGLSPPPKFHELRHFYASLLIRHGESVKTVQRRLGHSTAAETLDTYSHLWPDSDDRTRAAVDAVLGSAAAQVRPKGLSG